MRPNGSVDRDLKLVLPDQAKGLPVTVTVEATEEGLAEPELLFFEGALPGGAAASPETQAPAGSRSRRWGSGTARCAWAR